LGVSLQTLGSFVAVQNGTQSALALFLSANDVPNNAAFGGAVTIPTTFLVGPSGIHRSIRT
jgi:hypothetical protein